MMRRQSTAELRLPPELLPVEDLTVQVHHDEDGRWHRRAIGGKFKLACGRDEPRGASLRMETYSGHLCQGGCFSLYELAENMRLRVEALAADDGKKSP